MYKILEKTQFSEKVFKFRIEAPAIAKHAHAGQFLMVRANETGERVPFTLAGWNGDEGWVEFIFMVIGKTTEMLSTYEAGESLRDVVGPLGVPTEMAEGPCAVIGGGVGLAIAFPVAKHLVETGHEVHAIMGARTKDLLLMEDQFRELLDALKTAANRFIDTIATQNYSITDESKQHQVAIVKFAGDKTTEVGNKKYRDSWGDTYNYSQTMKNLTPCKDKGAESLKSTVNSISPDGSTRADYGLELADGQFSFGRADAKKIVVFFTDGSPTSSSGFQASVANSAINSAKSLKNKGADIYTIGIFDGANPSADLTADGTSKENKFMHAVSSNYPAASSSISFWGEWTINFGARAENANYYKSATSAAELEEIFKDISGSIIQAGYPTKTHSGYGEHKSGYITFTDELGDFMQVDDFTSVVYGGETFEKPSKKSEGNVDTYTFSGAAAAPRVGL